MSISIPHTTPGQELLVHGQQYAVVSLRPIWAWAVIFAGKDVENRAVGTDHRGRVLIHASTDKTSFREDHNLRAELSFLSGIGRAELPVIFPRGVILGSIEIADCVQDARSKWAVPGQYHWQLREPRALSTPLPNVEGSSLFWSYTFEAKTRRARTSGVFAASSGGASAPIAMDDDDLARSNKPTRNLKRG